MQHYCNSSCYNKDGIKRCDTSDIIQEPSTILVVSTRELVLMKSIIAESSIVEELHGRIREQLEVLNNHVTKIADLSSKVTAANNKIASLKIELTNSFGLVPEVDPNQQGIYDQLGRNE